MAECKRRPETAEELSDKIKKPEAADTVKCVFILLLKKEGWSAARAARLLGRSERTGQRWLKLYEEGGITRPLKDGRKGSQKASAREYATQEALEKLCEAIEAGKVTTYCEAHDELKKHGCRYRDRGSVYKLMKRHDMLIKDVLRRKREREKARKQAELADQGSARDP